MQTDWSQLLKDDDSNTQFNTFLMHVHETMDQISPIKNVRISPKHRFVEPWMTRGLEISSRRKQQLYKKAITAHVTEADRHKYTVYRNNYNKT